MIAVGAPLALSNTVTYGIVSALDRPVVAGESGSPRYYAAIQTDAAVNQGNSGGPLFDLAGRAIGINSVIKSLSADQQSAGNVGLAFAIPINQAKRQAQDIIERGKARRTVLGATPDTTYRSPAGGVKLQAVTAGRAGRAGGAEGRRRDHAGGDDRSRTPRTSSRWCASTRPASGDRALSAQRSRPCSASVTLAADATRS